jgi:biotin-dependent carboxylase-like uncharacterized protein
MRKPALEVLRAPALVTVQDLGRAGLAHLAVPRSGALDPGAHNLANRLVGNPVTAATLETTFAGVTVRFAASRYATVTGAWAPITVDGCPRAWAVPFFVRAGQVLDVGPATRGVRCYLGVAGGIAVPPVLGSRATDVFSGLGPPPLRPGHVLPLGPLAAEPAAIDYAPYPPPTSETVRLTLGPRHEFFTGQALRSLHRATYVVASASNRVALRLQGPPVHRQVTTELPSEGLTLGAVEVPPDGIPLVMLADHPTTGGYPVLGVLDPADLPTCAQGRPGDRLTIEIMPPPALPPC